MTTEDGRLRPLAPAHTPAAGVRDREEEVVAQLRRLSTALDDEPASGFRAGSRARLVAMAAVRSPEPAPPGVLRRLLGDRAGARPPSRWRTRVTSGLTGAALAVGALGALVALSADARPGDLLYDLKRGTEQTQLALAGDDRGVTLLQFASTRLDELAAASDDPELVVRTLATMDAQTTEGAALLVGAALGSREPETADRLVLWSERQSAGLASLRPELPSATSGAAQASLDLLGAVRARVAAVQAALACPAVPADAGSDALGPIPGLCRPGTPSVPLPAGGPPSVDPGTPSGDDPAASVTPPPAVPQPGDGGTAGAPGPGRDAGSGPGPAPGAGPDGDLPSTDAGPAAPPVPAPLPGPGGGLLPVPPVPAVPGAPTTIPRPVPPPSVDAPLPLCGWPLDC